MKYGCQKNAYVVYLCGTVEIHAKYRTNKLRFVISGGFTMVGILVSWSMWLSAKSKEGLNLLALILIDISPRATQFVFKLRSCSYWISPSTHTTSFWRLYSIHNVKTTSYGRQNNVACVLGSFIWFIILLSLLLEKYFKL